MLRSTPLQDHKLSGFILDFASDHASGDDGWFSQWSLATRSLRSDGNETNSRWEVCVEARKCLLMCWLIWFCALNYLWLKHDIKANISPLVHVSCQHFSGIPCIWYQMINGVRTHFPWRNSATSFIRGSLPLTVKCRCILTPKWLDRLITSGSKTTRWIFQNGYSLVRFKIVIIIIWVKIIRWRT